MCPDKTTNECGYCFSFWASTEYQSTDDINFTEKQSYVYATYIDDPLVLVKANSDRFYYHSNSQFSISKITDEYKNVVESYAYNAYGDVQILQSYAGLDTPHYFTGRQLDQETGLFYFRARCYDAKLGQFISRDPIGYVDGFSLYRGYFAVNGVDWSGLEETNITGHSSTPRYAQKGITVTAFGDVHLVTLFHLIFHISTPTDHPTFKKAWEKDYKKWIADPKNKTNYYPISINNTESNKNPADMLIKELEKIYEANNKNCIGVLNLVVHGLPGGITTSVETRDFSLGQISNMQGDKISEMFCEDAVINLCGCETASDPSMLQNMANTLKRKVCGCTFYLTKPCDCLGQILCTTPIP